MNNYNIEEDSEYLYDIIDELNEVNEEIEKIKSIERALAWKAKNRMAVKKNQKEWYEKKGKEYNRAYYKKHRKKPKP